LTCPRASAAVSLFESFSQMPVRVFMASPKSSHNCFLTKRVPPRRFQFADNESIALRDRIGQERGTGCSRYACRIDTVFQAHRNPMQGSQMSGNLKFFIQCLRFI